MESSFDFDRDLSSQKETYYRQQLQYPRYYATFISSLCLFFQLIEIAFSPGLFPVSQLTVVGCSVALLIQIVAAVEKQCSKLVKWGFVLNNTIQFYYLFVFISHGDTKEDFMWSMGLQFSCAQGVALYYYHFDHNDRFHTLIGLAQFNAIMASILMTAEKIPCESSLSATQKWILIACFVAYSCLFLSGIFTENFQQKYMDSLFRRIAESRLLHVVLDSYSEGVIIFDEKKQVSYVNPKIRKLSRECGFSISHLALSRGDSVFRSSQKSIYCKLRDKLKDFFTPILEMSEAERTLQIDQETQAFRQNRMLKEIKDSDARLLCIEDLLLSEIHDNDQVYALLKPSEEDNQQYIRVHKACVTFDKQLLTVFQIVDVTNSIQISRVSQQNELLSILNATISHELRNPLNAIVGFNLTAACIFQEMKTTLAQFEPDSEELAKKLEVSLDRLTEGQKVAECSTQIMTFLVQDFLDYAQIKSAKFRTEASSFDLKEAIAQVMEIQEHRVRDIGVDLKAEYPESCSDGRPFTVVTDKQRLMQVLLNLQSNALKFTREGSVVIRSEIQNKEGYQFLRISVSDTGIGIPFADQDKLFKVFGFVESTESMNKNGVGLGLVISEKIVRQLGGEIGFESRPIPDPNHGTTFYFTLKLTKVCHEPEVEPMDPNEEGRLQPLVWKWVPPLEVRSHSKYDLDIEEETSFPMPPNASLTMTLYSNSKHKMLNQTNDNGPSENSFIPFEENDETDKKRILIADDQEFNIHALRSLLECKFGINPSHIDSAKDGQEALKRCQRTNYGLIFMDCNMPFMDGFEASSKIREFYWREGLCQNEQPVISALTGHAEPKFVTQCYDSGMNLVLNKPVELKALENLLEALNYA